MTKVNRLHKKWMKKPEYREAFEGLAPEFALARAAIAAPVESGRARPSTQTTERLAAARELPH